MIFLILGVTNDLLQIFGPGFLFFLTFQQSPYGQSATASYERYLLGFPWHVGGVEVQLSSALLTPSW